MAGWETANQEEKEDDLLYDLVNIRDNDGEGDNWFSA